ncbi:MAG: peptidylprolyl isomerase [Nanoarchaeota archaeon]
MTDEKQIVKRNDFVEIEFTARDNSNKIFDTTKPKEAEEMGLKNPETVRPLIISVGNNMVLSGLDEEFKGKELNKDYSVNLMPEKAFGKRNPALIKTYSLSHFTKQNIAPHPGLVLQLDNVIAKVISVSGGRVTIDFNNPLAGKPVTYNFKIIKKITDDKEKINALQDFFFKKRFEFKLEENSKKVIFKDEMAETFLNLFKEKFKEMTGFDFEVEKTDDKKEIKEMKESKKKLRLNKKN